MATLRDIRDYHDRTQHHLHRFARSLGGMDWSTQPAPFRHYDGAPGVPLPLVAPTGQPRYAALFGDLPAPAPITAPTIGQWLQDSLGLSAWKQHAGHRWALRVNPSSGNLHPTEAYLLAPAMAGLADSPALHHYAPDAHALERRADVPTDLWHALVADLHPSTVLLGLSTIPWRESWKYGERALRYCMHDLGHALAALGFAAAALGWRTTLLPVTDAALATLLGIDGQHGPEAERPGLLLAVHPRTDAALAREHAFAPDDALLAALRALPRFGVPSVLSRGHHDWPVIDEAFLATRQAAATPATFDRRTFPLPRAVPPPDRDARALFAQRRSAVAMDGRTGTDLATLLATLQRTLDPSSPSHAALPWRGRVHLVLFLHRVTGLAPGIYCLVRGGQPPEWLRQRLRPELLWERPPAAPTDLPLFLLLPIDCRDAARTVSCGQAIAADGAFAVAMLAEFAPTLAAMTAWAWRALHWEAGAIGQLLYLDAEAHGLRATGIGCFADSAVHELLGIRDDDLRTVYHFTVGGPVEDTRLQTLPPYPADR